MKAEQQPVLTVLECFSGCNKIPCISQSEFLIFKDSNIAINNNNSKTMLFNIMLFPLCP